MKQADPQFKMRLPPALKEKLQAAAEIGGRTLSAEIINRLERTFADDAQQTVTQCAIDDAFARLLERLQPLLATPEELALRARREAIQSLSVPPDT